jgi:hypothetical protein
MRAIGIAGWSGAGKTTPIRRLIPELRHTEHAARQARDIPVFGRTGNLNSLFGRINSLFDRVGNFPGTALNRWAFRDGLSPSRPKNERLPAFFPGLHPLGETRKSGTGCDVGCRGLLRNGLRPRLSKGLGGASRERARPPLRRSERAACGDHREPLRR